MGVLPMFPLGTVLLPGAVLPLHVFEPRYRALVKVCLAAPAPEFGVTLIERGSEVGGGDVRTDVGCVARMVQVAETPDGRYAVVAVGVRRIRVVQWLPDDPYPIAEVDEWPDADEAVTGDRIAATLAAVHRAAALAAELGEGGDISSEVADDPVLASYHLSALAPLATVDRYRLLCAAGPSSRLDLLDELVADAHSILEFRLRGAQ